MAEFYDVNRYSALYRDSKTPPLLNLLMSAKWLSDLLNANNVRHAFSGNFAMYLRANTNQGDEVDLIVMSEMRELFAQICPEYRLCIPRKPRLVTNQVFVQTGGLWDGLPQPSKPICFNLIQAGYFHTPILLPLGTEFIQPVVETPFGPKGVQVIDVHYHFAGTLDKFFKDSQYVDFGVLAHFSNVNAAEVFKERFSLDKNQRQYFFQMFTAYNRMAADCIHFLANMLGLSVYYKPETGQWITTPKKPGEDTDSYMPLSLAPPGMAA